MVTSPMTVIAFTYAVADALCGVCYIMNKLTITYYHYTVQMCISVRGNGTCIKLWCQVLHN